MSTYQNAILQDLPAQADYLSFTLHKDAGREQVRAALQRLQPFADGQKVVLGIGATLANFLDVHIAGLRDFGGIEGSKVALPATPAALWLWLRDSERGELVHQQRRVLQALAGAFELQQQVAAFKYADGRDLSGYEDGTENPHGEEAQAVAIAVDGSSYVAVQQWEHRFERLQAMPEAEQDLMIGRRKSDNEELDDAPESAHVKRTAQESFEP
ncbi:MAG: Dyp-type peroxidase, partial [Burkholderiales bacterium]|nr:Dyp-type peroxidase [Burkholderiales bacterium]